jgi:tetratricopeptide (TPR) repeat protein
MNEQTSPLDWGLVDIAREFMVAHRLTRRLFGRYRQGLLSFEEVQELVGDTDGSVLFRLKERCHALFRSHRRASDLTMRREALFDLAVGSLFHEAMKFRENFYQQAVYGPKVRELRRQSGPEAVELFREFEKILDAASVRLDEALQETEALLAQTGAQFRLLLQAHRTNGLVARHLVEHATLVEEVFGRGIDALLAESHGDAAQGYTFAARAYLESGCFDRARRALDQAVARAGERVELRRLGAYADGMVAYLGGRYPEALERLEAWLDAEPPPSEADLAALAHAAVGRVPQLVPEAERGGIGARAARFAERVAERLPGGAAAASPARAERGA